MPKPTSSYVGTNDDSSHDYNNDAYGYNYIYDYPIGNVPMYFPIRNTEDINLPKRIYIGTNDNPRMRDDTPLQEEDDYLLYYIVFAILAVGLILYTTR
jgi:hypothetical protein